MLFLSGAEPCVLIPFQKLSFVVAVLHLVNVILHILQWMDEWMSWFQVWMRRSSVRLLRFAGQLELS